MPWKYVACKLNYKGRCPGIIHIQDFEKFREECKKKVPTNRKEMRCPDLRGICYACSNAKGTDNRRNEKRKNQSGGSTMYGGEDKI